MDSTAWQDRLSDDFPHGILMTWYERQDGPAYLITRPEVLNVTNSRPLVSLDAHGAEKNFTIRITGYTELARDPLQVLVTGATYTEAMVWTAVEEGTLPA